ncbi:MATE family efflux transporter [Campylobacter insulaenigrae]|nr:MATE family efflux transporter [Campylobacter insulaenigrae]
MSIRNFYTNSNPTTLFIKCALPNMASMAFIYLYVIIDGIFVGKYLDSDALAAMNLMIPFIMISFALADMIAIGSSVQIAINLGKAKVQKAKQIFSFCIILIFIISCIMGILEFFLAQPLGIAMGADQNIQLLSTQYMQIFALFSPIIIISFAIDNYLRVCGKTLYSMVINILIALINIFLDWLFIVVFQWGVFSAALATCIGMSIGSILAFIPFVFQNLTLKFSKPLVSFNTLKNIIYNGSSEFFSNISSSIYTILANILLLNISGNIAVAAFSVITYLSTFSYMIVIGMCDAMQPAISYNYGCKNISRIKQIFKRMFWGSCIFSFLIFLCVFFYHENIVSFFNKEQNELFLTIGSNALYLFCFSLLINWFGDVGISIFTALDKPLLSLFVSIMQNLILPYLFLKILTHFFNLNGVWITPFVADCIILIIVSLMLKKVFKHLNS